MELPTQSVHYKHGNEIVYLNNSRARRAEESQV